MMKYAIICCLLSIGFILSGCGKTKEFSITDLSPDTIEYMYVTLDYGIQGKKLYKFEKEYSDLLSLLEKTTYYTRKYMNQPQIVGGESEIIIFCENRINYYIYIPPAFEGEGKTPAVVLEKQGSDYHSNQYENESAFMEFIKSKGKLDDYPVSSIMSEVMLFCNDSVTYSFWRNWKD